jgi:hypothetical protein
LGSSGSSCFEREFGAIIGPNHFIPIRFSTPQCGEGRKKGERRKGEGGGRREERGERREERGERNQENQGNQGTKESAAFG